MSQTQDQAAVASPTRSATYASVIVHAEPGEKSSHRVRAAARIARAFGARLIGLGAEAFEPMPVVDPFLGYAAGDWVALIQEQIAKDLKDAEEAFRRDTSGSEVEWRSVQDFPARALARAARAADLIVACPRQRTDGARVADPAELVMTAGRPVLLVPEGAGHLHGRTVLVAWKDTREARRAVADAMPFLTRAEDVIVQAVCEDDAVETAKFQAEDVAAALRRHGAPARPAVTVLTGESVTSTLLRAARAAGADLIVSGAYGHSRMQEWVFGGVTDDLIRDPGCFVLLSH